MDRRNVNPWDWSKAFGFSQGVLLDGAKRLLVCAGQAATGPDGSPPSSPDLADQVRKCFDNLRKVLADADMSLANVVRLALYTTDADALVGTFGTVIEALGDNRPAMTLVGVTRLAFPQLKLEIEATAVA